MIMKTAINYKSNRKNTSNKHYVISFSFLYIVFTSLNEL